MGRGGGDSGKPGASEAASLVFRIATVGLSLASAIMTVASTQCVQSVGGCPAGAGTVSYSDYNSFKYSALANLLSAVLQGVAIYLEVMGKEKAAKAVELIDKLVLALTASSAALLLAVDDITSCGPPRGSGSRRQRSSLCGQAGRFCGQVRLSSAFSLAATVSVSISVYTRHVPVHLRPPAPTATTPRRPSPPGSPPRRAHLTTKITKDPPVEEKKKEEEEKKKNDGEEGTKKKEDNQCCTLLTPPTMPPPPYCGCPRLTIPCGCENPELCGAFF